MEKKISKRFHVAIWRPKKSCIKHPEVSTGYLQCSSSVCVCALLEDGLCSNTQQQLAGQPKNKV